MSTQRKPADDLKREKRLAAKRRYREKHRDDIAAHRKAYYQKNKDKVLQKCSERYYENRDLIRAQAHERYIRNKQSIRQRYHTWYVNKGSKQFLGFKLSAAKRKFAQWKHKDPNDNRAVIDIDIKYLYDLLQQQDNKCAITGKEMLPSFGDIRSISIDRIDSSKGYIKGNIQLVCQIMNFAKSKYPDNAIKEFFKH